MITIPDAPYIRDAEMNGIPSADPPICPICKSEAERFYFLNGDSDILGCENCIDWKDAYDVETERWRDE